MSIVSVIEVDELDDRLEVARRALRVDGVDEIIASAMNREKYNINILFGYIRSFVGLAAVKDVSVVADQFSTTRQTIGRHVHELENMIGCELFASIGARSELTDSGRLWTSRASEILDLAAPFMVGASVEGPRYRSTQVPLRVLLDEGSKSSPRLREFVNAWMRCDKRLASPDLARFCSELIVYERRNGAWYAKQIGENTALSDRYGIEDTTVGAGMRVTEIMSGADLHDEVSFLLDAVYTRGGVHFSEVSCRLVNPITGLREPMLYERALVELTDDLGKPVIASLIQVFDLPQGGQEPD